MPTKLTNKHTLNKNTLVYCDFSDTIRQMPQNHLIAHKAINKWICDPDLAADIKLATKVFKALFIFDNKYGDGENLINYINNQ